jgi:hypothetical protein
MQRQRIESWRLYGLPDLSIRITDDGLAAMTINDTEDATGETIYLAVQARHAERLAAAIDAFNLTIEGTRNDAGMA